jgi:predicted RecA/RadA family phage recombinase
MTVEATYFDDAHEYKDRATASIAVCEVQQMNNGRAAVRSGGITGAAASGDDVAFTDEGVFTVIKTAGEVWIDGGPLWWDHSANKATCIPPLTAGDRDFFLGCAVGDALSAATSGKVNLNVQPSYIIDFMRDAGDTVVVLTAGTPYIYNRGASMEAGFSLTAEAQKLDWISKRSFALAANWVLEAVLEISTNGDANVVDVSLGVANATHASDADAITESAFFHLDPGNDLNIYAESDDGTTEVAATDTTLDWAVGTPVHLVLDGRDPSNVKYYVNGVEVLSGTANLGNIAAAAGPLKALFHMEKSANDSPGVARLSQLRVRTAERD